MLSGRYRYYAAYQWEMSYNLTDAESGGVSMTSYYAPNSADKPIGIQMALSTNLSADETELAVSIPALLYSDTFTTGAFQSNASATLTINDLEIYIRPTGLNPFGGWFVQWSSIEIYLEGALVDTIPSNIVVSSYFTPAGIPLIGVPPRLTGAGGVGVIPVNGSFPTCTTEYETIEDGACTFTGGWRVKMTSDGEWKSAPLSVHFPNATPDLECPCSIDLPDWPSYSFTNCWNAQGTAGAKLTNKCELIGEDLQCDPCAPYKLLQPTIYDLYKGTTTYETWSSTVMLLPNVPKEVKRWKSANYQQMVLRAGFPAAIGQAFHVCGPWGVDPGTTITNTVTEETYPSLPAYLANVGNAAHEIEDPMGYDSYAPAAIGRSIGQAIGYNGVTTQFGLCGLTLETSGLPLCSSVASSTCYAAEGKQWPLAVEDSIDNPYMLGAHDHEDEEVRLINTWFSPHASYFVWFPPNTEDTDGDSIPDEQTQWQVGGADIARQYWEDVRSQWLSQDDLPTGEKTANRNHLPLDGLTYHDIGLWINVLTSQFGGDGMHSGFWGVHNFIVDQFAPPSSLAYDSTSEPLFTATNCTLSFGGGGITVTPDPGETELTVECDLGSFTTYPYMYPHIAAMFELGWTVTGATVAVYLVSREGTSKLITTTPGTFARPLGLDSKYAYSYAQDYGAGYLYDQGEDSMLTGDSADMMSEPEDTHFFQMLAGRGAAKLRWVITVT